MNNIIASLIASLALISSANAATYVEKGDAGYSVLTSQFVAKNTNKITGTLKGTDSVDVFAFNWTGGIFTATTSSNFDPMLFLFNSTGTKLAFNDDTFGLQSHIGLNLNKGKYLLGVNQYRHNYGGNIAGFAGAPSFTAPNGNYTISLNRAVDGQVPEPASLGLLGVAALGVAFARRRKNAK